MVTACPPPNPKLGPTVLSLLLLRQHIPIGIRPRRSTLLSMNNDLEVSRRHPPISIDIRSHKRHSTLSN